MSKGKEYTTLAFTVIVLALCDFLAPIGINRILTCVVHSACLLSISLSYQVLGNQGPSQQRPAMVLDRLPLRRSCNPYALHELVPFHRLEDPSAYGRPSDPAGVRA